MTQTNTSILQPNTATRLLSIKAVTSAHFEKWGKSELQILTGNTPTSCIDLWFVEPKILIEYNLHSCFESIQFALTWFILYLFKLAYDFAYTYLFLVILIIPHLAQCLHK